MDLSNYDSVFDAISDKKQETADNVAQFKNIVESMAATYARKNADYGDSFSISVQKYGPIAALTRMSDKWNRLENLILNKGNNLVKDESVSDTLLDLASYAIMTYMELMK